MIQRHDFGSWLTVFQDGDRTAVVVHTGDDEGSAPWLWCLTGKDYRWDNDRVSAETAARRALAGEE